MKVEDTPDLEPGLWGTLLYYLARCNKDEPGRYKLEVNARYNKCPTFVVHDGSEVLISGEDLGVVAAWLKRFISWADD